MGFKDNLKRKITIERLYDSVSASLGPPGSGRKIDKRAMRSLLDMAGYQAGTERGIEFYRKASETEKNRILVLENEMTAYDTTLQDVLLRKNPTIKEMVNIFNMKKILNDKDVAVSKGSDTIAAVRAECMAGLDLTYRDSDIYEIAEDGRIALSDENSERVDEVLGLFAELLSLLPPPVPLSIPEILVIGPIQRKGGSVIYYGPVFIHDRKNHALMYFDCRLEPEAMKMQQTYLDMAYGREPATLEGGDVFGELAEKVIKKAPQLTE